MEKAQNGIGSLNRTILELKPNPMNRHAKSQPYLEPYHFGIETELLGKVRNLKKPTLNRTILELKPIRGLDKVLSGLTLNRTILELKLGKARYGEPATAALEPYHFGIETTLHSCVRYQHLQP